MQHHLQRSATICNELQPTHQLTYNTSTHLNIMCLSSTPYQIAIFVYFCFVFKFDFQTGQKIKSEIDLPQKLHFGPMLHYLLTWVTRILSINPLRCSGKIKVCCDNIVVLWLCGLPTPSPKTFPLRQYSYRNRDREFWSIETSLCPNTVKFSHYPLNLIGYQMH